MQIVALLALIAGGVWWYDMNSASGGMSGKTYYEACWAYRTKSGSTAPTPGTPYEAAQWKKCEPVAKRAFFDSGMIFAGGGTDDDSKRLASVCPSFWSDVPLGGFYYMYVAHVEERGGLNPFDGMMPAYWSISGWANKKWPKCSEERQRQGYPLVVQKSDQDFGWSQPCAKCK